jgi:integrase
MNHIYQLWAIAGAVDQFTAWGLYWIPADETKERHETAIPINHHVKAVLDGQLRHLHHDFVFTFGREPIIGLGACKGAGVTYGRKAAGGITMHDIRRTVKTNMLAAGVDKT